MEHVGVLQAGKMGNLSFSPLDHLLPVTSRLSFWSHIVLSTENLDCGLPVLRDLPWPLHGLLSKHHSLELWPFVNCPSHPSSIFCKSLHYIHTRPNVMLCAFLPLDLGT